MFGLTKTPFIPDAEDMELLKLLTDGLNQKKIAEKFNIKQSTLRNHLTSLRHKLGVKTLGQLMFEYGRYTYDKEHEVVK